MNSVPGLQEVRSITSRGSAEIDLFFDWNVDMFQTLQYVNAAISRVQPELPPTASVVANRMTFASFPIIGYSLTSATVPQTQLWEMATYEIKPRLNRLDGVSTVLVQGGQEPEFHITPDPAKLLSRERHRHRHSGHDAAHQPDRFPGLFERNHQLVLGLVSGQVRTPATNRGHGHQEHARGNSGAHRRRGHGRARGEARIHNRDGQRQTCGAAQHQPPARQQHRAGRGRSSRQVEEIRKSLPPGIDIEPFYDQSIIVGDSIKSVRDAILLG